jgi:hypothetical protein
VQQQQSAGKLQARWRGLKARVAVAPALFASRAAHRAARKEGAAMSTEDARSHALRAWCLSKYYCIKHTCMCVICNLVTTVRLVDCSIVRIASAELSAANYAYMYPLNTASYSRYSYTFGTPLYRASSCATVSSTSRSTDRARSCA